jgi:hypothetical protein
MDYIVVRKYLVDLCLYELDDEQCVAYGTELSLQKWTLEWSSCVGLSFTYHYDTWAFREFCGKTNSYFPYICMLL